MSDRFETGPPTQVSPAILHVRLLGPPEVRWAGQPLTIPRRQTRALLYRLAARLEPVPREQICFLFWPDIPESNARRNLRRLLTNLRAALPAPQLLVSVNDHVGLDPDRAWSDTAAFERLESMPASQAHVEGLRETVADYRGPFLDGFSLPDSAEFEAWAWQERQTWERQVLQALLALVDAETERGAHEAAIGYAQRYLEIDELAETLHRRLIALYGQAGARTAAMRQFERCAAVLERELGVDPLPETQAAYRAVLTGEPAPVPEARLAWTTLPSLEVPLVGRDDALRQLQRAYARARAGQPSLVLISGEAGIGKSRLLQAFASRLGNEALILLGTGHPGEQTPPYQPIVQALRPALNLQSSIFNRYGWPRPRCCCPNCARCTPTCHSRCRRWILGKRSGACTRP